MRDDALQLCFDVVPTLTKFHLPVNNIPTSDGGALLYDKYCHLLPAVSGHHRALLLATRFALSSLNAAVPAFPHKLLEEKLRPVVTVVGKGTYLQFTSVLADSFACLVASVPAPVDWFHANIADKLLEDLQNWVPVNTIREAMGNSGKEPDIAAAIVNLFHVLPLNADRVLPELARVCALLDVKLHQFRSKGVLTSPLRGPFARVLSAHAPRAAAWLFSERRLLNSAYGAFFAACAVLPEAAGFLRHLASGDGARALARRPLALVVAAEGAGVQERVRVRLRGAGRRGRGRGRGRGGNGAGLEGGGGG